ncbi:MAG: hypothetical protein ACREMY_03665 [bacterium]
MATLTIHDRTATGRPVDSMTLEGLPDRITIRDLIRIRVREEVARHNLKAVTTPATRATFRGLVTPLETEADLNHAPKPPRRIDWEAQAKVAVAAFGKNGFFVLVNGRQAIDLDEEVELIGAADVGFVRLIPLIGG